MLEKVSPPASSARDQHDGPADYLTSLLIAAPADVKKRLAEIGDFVINEQNLTEMRARQIRDPGTPSDTVEHVNHLVPGDPDVPVRLHRERGVTELRPSASTATGSGSSAAAAAG